MKKTTSTIAATIALLAMLGMLAGGICATVAAFQEFGFLGLFLNKGIFRLGMLWGQPLFMTALAIEAVSTAVFSAAYASMKR